MVLKTDYLFAKPSFISGVARVLDLGATLNVYNESPNVNTADARGIASDWMTVGEDIKQVLEQHVVKK